MKERQKSAPNSTSGNTGLLTDEMTSIITGHHNRIGVLQNIPKKPQYGFSYTDGKFHLVPCGNNKETKSATLALKEKGQFDFHVTNMNRQTLRIAGKITGEISDAGFLTNINIATILN